MCTYSYFRWQNPACAHYLGIGCREVKVKCEWKDTDPSACMKAVEYAIEPYWVVLEDGKIMDICKVCWDGRVSAYSRYFGIPSVLFPTWPAPKPESEY